KRSSRRKEKKKLPPKAGEETCERWRRKKGWALGGGRPMMERVPAGNETAFRVGFTGHSGHLRLELLPPVEGNNPLRSLPDFILPPAFEPVTPESVKRQLEEKYLLPRLDPDEFSVEKSGRQWDFDWFDRVKVHLEPTAPRTVMVPKWELPFRRHKDGSATAIWDPCSIEVDVAELMEDAQGSGTFLRMPGPAKDFVRGSTKNRPFRPGGLDDPQSSDRLLPEGALNGQWIRELIAGGDPQTVPPGLRQGMDLGRLKEYPCQWKRTKEHSSGPQTASEDNLITLSVQIQFDDLFNKDWEDDDVGGSDNHGNFLKPASTDPKAERTEEDLAIASSTTESSVLDEILLTEAGGLPSKPIRDSSNEGQQREVWARTCGSEGIANHFYELIPDLALDFPFELDNFQKEVSTCT
ncbi:hypothetical protein Taro_017524, partial [Colocasia esculenta]|nr:hypothetical protein [Colocasia esculenta]